MRKRFLLLTTDILLLICACYGAYLLKFFPDVKIELLYKLFFTLVIVELIYLQIVGAYKWSFTLANISEFMSLASALALGGGTSYLIAGYFEAWSMWQLFIIQVIVALIFISTFRFSVRLRNSLIWGNKQNLKKALIIGAGEAGEIIAKKMKQDPSFGYVPIAFIDDDPRKKGMKIRGIKVVGDSSVIPRIAEEKNIDEIIITMPSVSGSVIRKVISYCETTNVKVKILPGVWEIILGDAYLHQIRDIQPEDLLGRETVKIDMASLKAFYDNKVVLVTGACGSIGGELISQLQQFGLKKLIAVDRNENEMYFLQYRKSLSSTEVIPVLCDVTNEARMRAIFATHKPNIVFHAAAYKHVPLMETFPEAAVKNNIQATQILADLTEEHNIEYFTLISTDKAVRPKNIMGYTKRIAELLIQGKAQKANGTKFLSVRFGNVLGSSGSIIPILKRQIRGGGPVTVTSKDAKRYFMTISEAVQLILQATSMAEGSEIFVLDMGEQVSIDTLARDMIRFMGLVPGKDIQIEYTGMRPGEKVEEDLFEKREEYNSTQHEKILVKINGYHDSIKNIEKDILHLTKKLQAEKNLRQDYVKEALRDFLDKYNIAITN
ncbi:SDR family NAD(P)-dependent oxidoreductase [Candidatus Omnitrophota bacterium]